jgi:predicted anti-sigma-YlaC factor YlaD
MAAVRANVRLVQGHCDRARQWASASVDAELSTFEQALLDDHLERCPSCREFRLSIANVTGALRSAPRERIEGLTIGRIRRRVALRLAPAAAAMAIVAVGLGSVLASVDLKGGSVARVQALPVAPAGANPDTLNLSTVAGLERLRAAQLAAISSGRGGHVALQS